MEIASYKKALTVLKYGLPVLMFVGILNLLASIVAVAPLKYANMALGILCLCAVLLDWLLIKRFESRFG